MELKGYMDIQVKLHKNWIVTKEINILTFASFFTLKQILVKILFILVFPQIKSLNKFEIVDQGKVYLKFN